MANERIDPRTVPGNPAYNPAAIPGGSNRHNPAQKLDFCPKCQDSTLHALKSGEGSAMGVRTCLDCMHVSPLANDSVMRRVASSMAGRRERNMLAELVPPKLEFVPLESNLEQHAMRAKVPGGWLLVIGESHPLYIPDPGDTWYQPMTRQAAE